MQAEQITDAITEHGEGPVWHPRDGLCVVDMLAGDVVGLGGGSEPHAGASAGTRWSVGEVAAVVRPVRDGSYVIATRDSFVRAERFGDPVTRIAVAFEDERIRFNEGGCDPAGSLLVGTMAFDASPGQGRMFKLDPRGAVTGIFGDLTISNGLCWTPDGAHAFYTDSPTQRIDVFDWDLDRGLHNRRPFVSIPREVGQPDGLTVDSEGGVWVALWGGAAVHRYTSSGSFDLAVSLPVPNVTACAFGGPDLDELFITTSRLDAGESAPEGAGAVYRVRPGVVGLPALPFGG